MGLSIPTNYYLVLITVVTIFGVSGLPGLNSSSNEIIDDSIQEFTFGLVQLSSAASHVNTCSGNGTESDGSCVCSEEWSGLQCEVQSSGG